MESAREIDDDSLNNGESADDPENAPDEYSRVDLAYEESEYMDVAPVGVSPGDNDDDDDDDGDSSEMATPRQVCRHY